MKINIGIKTCSKVIREYKEEGKVNKESRIQHFTKMCRRKE